MTAISWLLLVMLAGSAGFIWYLISQGASLMDENADLHRDIEIKRKKLEDADCRLEAIAAQSTPSANATVKRMVKIARGEA